MPPFLFNNALRRALLLSLAAHLVLLSLFVTKLPQAGNETAPGTMRALLVQQNGHQNLTPTPPSTKHLATNTSADHKPKSPRNTPQSKPKPFVVAADKVSFSKASGEQAISSEPGTAKANNDSLSPVVETGNTGTSAEGLRTYRLALGREARRLKLEYDRKYSQIERNLQKGWEGRVEMNVRADPAGTTVLLTRSSGHASLDEQALELIGRAARHTALPDSLRGQHFLLPVALEFEISKE